MQPKLTVGAPDDAFEKKADAVAEEVVSPQTVTAANGAGYDDDGEPKRHLARKPADPNLARQLLLRQISIRTLHQTLGNRTLARLLEQTSPAQGRAEVRCKCGCGGEPQAEGECADCRANRLALQREATGQDTGSEAPSIVEEVLRTSGQPVAASARKTLEPGFGHDFSQVRIHDDSKAAESASAVNALAYTVGNHIVFGAGQYSPGKQNGNRLLAHELTHTIQQTGGMALADQMVEPGSAAPLQVDASAPAMVAGRSARVSAQPAVIARILDTSLPRPQIDFPPGLLAACPTLADWRQLDVDADLRSLVEAYRAVETAKAAYDTANAAVDSKDGTKPSQAASDAAQKAATDYISVSTDLSQQCRSLASKLYQPKFNLNPAASAPNPAPSQPAEPGLDNTPPAQPQPGVTVDAVAAKLAKELTALAEQQGSVISGAARSSRHAKQVGATFLAHYRETLPFAWSTVQDTNDATINDWFRYYELDLPKDKSKPLITGDDAIVFFNGSDVRYGDVLDTFISEANKAGFSFNRDHVWEVTADFLNGRQQLQDRLTGGTKPKPGLAAPSVALQSQINFTGHRTLVKKDPSNTQDPPTWQVTGQITVPLHPEGQAGFEFTAQGAVSFVMTQDGKVVDGTLKLTDPKATVTNVQGAAQLAWVQSFVEGELKFQYQAFVQAVGGASWVQDSTSVNTTAVTLKPTGMFQAVGGMQLVFVIPGTGDHLQLFIQLQTSATRTMGQPSTLDVQGAGGVQIQFNIF